MNSREWLRTAIVLIVFAVVFAGLCVASYTQKSATVDETLNLASGYAALKAGDHRLACQNMPFTRMWSALPLLLTSGIEFDPHSEHLAALRGWEYANEFLYERNDADALLYRARAMTVFFGVLLGVVLFCWARELFGFWPSVIVLGLYATEPNFLAHSGLVTSDVGFTCFFTATLYFLWRASQPLTLGIATGVTGCFALALLCKQSGFVLAVIVASLLAILVLRNQPWPCQLRGITGFTTRRSRALAAVGLLVAMALAAFVAIWALYGFRYAPSAADQLLDFTRAGFIRERSPVMVSVLGWVDSHRLMPNAWTQGFLLLLSEMSGQPAFLAGCVSNTGWWYYFPVAYVIKTSPVLLVLFAAGAIAGFKRRHGIHLLIPILLFLVIAMTAQTDVGVRYVLPIFPLVILVAGAAVAAILRGRRWQWKALLAALLLFQVVECARIHPDHLAYFNPVFGGAKHGHKWLVDSNLDWGQDLKGLARWMKENKVEHINLSYFGSADPLYYEMDYTPLIGSPFFDQRRVQGPKLPGYVAVSATNLRGVYLGKARNYFQPLLRTKPSAVIGHSIHVYWVENPWWTE